MDGDIHGSDNRNQTEMVLMGALPSSAVGLVSLFFFVAFLVFLMHAETQGDPLHGAIDTINSNNVNFQNTAANLSQQPQGTSFWSTLSKLDNFMQMLFALGNVIVGYVSAMFMAIVTFISSITSLPIEISTIIVIMSGVGFFFSIFKYIIPE